VVAIVMIAVLPTARAVALEGGQSLASLHEALLRFHNHIYGLYLAWTGEQPLHTKVVVVNRTEPNQTTEFTPRPAAELKIHEPSGKDTVLSSLKGNVVVVQFLFTWCPHCQVTAKWLSQMEQELGPKGLKILGVAFNDQVNTQDSGKNKAELDKFRGFAKFPVGASPKEPVLRFLQFAPDEAFGVPQLVVIDRRGMIRAQSAVRPGQGDLGDEPVMRAVVENLLRER
jgi:thiol-disulfide isomerase/thioredoxin